MMEYKLEKIDFLRKDLPQLLRSIKPNTVPLFGKMNPQQMVEHLAEYFRLGYGNPRIAEAAYSEDVLEKMNRFLHSEKPLRPNTVNPLMSETPAPVLLPSYEAAIGDLEKACAEMFAAFETEPNLVIDNPFFGKLDFELTKQLLYKHSQHHLRQFGALV